MNIGGIFEGIGNTFLAGSNADVARRNERMQKEQLEADAENAGFRVGAERMAVLLGLKQQDAQILKIVVVAGVLVLVAIIVVKLFRRK